LAACVRCATAGQAQGGSTSSTFFCALACEEQRLKAIFVEANFVEAIFVEAVFVEAILDNRQ
jgi:hypothetical protein